MAAFTLLDFYNRQERSVSNRMLPRSLELRAPYVRHEWTSFMLRTARHHREGRMVQREMLRRFYASLYGDAPLGDVRSQLRPIACAWRYARLAGYMLGFPAPTNPWFIDDARENVPNREDLRSTIEELIEAAAGRLFLDGRRVRRLWRNFLARREVRWRKVHRVARSRQTCRRTGFRR